jgi:hypothetical protein
LRSEEAAKGVAGSVATRARRAGPSNGHFLSVRSLLAEKKKAPLLLLLLLLLLVEDAL